MMGGGMGTPQSFTPPPAPTQPAQSYAPSAPASDPVKMVNGKKAPVQPDFPEI
jgi:hypothetical protein